jgi:pimeloyl-ACP methyl ester carboxylesterase
MVNGRYDPIVPFGESQQRFLKLLPNDASKQILLDELGHFGFPRHRFHAAVLDWLDEQMGSVR